MDKAFEASMIIICIAICIRILMKESMVGEQNIKVQAYYSTKFSDILDQLDFLMDREMAFSIELPFEGRDIKRLTDFEESLHMLTSNVTSSLNGEFFAKANAAGLNDDFLLEYITRGCTIRLLKFIRDNNAGYTGGNEGEGE